MASRTQMRLAQLTGSFGLLPGQISDQRPEQASAANAAALLMSSGSLLGPFSEMASAIKRIHGGDQFAAAAPGQFFVDIQSANILPDAQNNKNLGSASKRFANLHLGTSINLDGFAITSIKDEDDMASDNNAALATQQSIKAYVDASVTAQDLDFKGDTGGDLEIDLDSERLIIAGGVALSTVGNANTVTVNLDNLGTAKSVGAVTKSLTATVDAQGRLSALGEANIAIPHSQVTDFEEAAEDFIGAALAAGEGLDYVYDDAAGTMTFSGEDSSASNKGVIIVAAGEGIDVNYSSGTATIVGEDASASNKGVASFASADFDVASGAVSIKDDSIVQDYIAANAVGPTELAQTAVTAADYGVLADDDKRATFSVDAQGRLTAAGNRLIDIAHTQVNDFDAGVRTNKVHELAVPTASFPMNSQKITGLLDPTDAQDAATKAYVDAEITDNNLGFQGDEGAGSLEIDLDAEKLSILGTANEIVTAGSGNAVTISLPDDVTIGRDLVVTRNLTVNGDQFKIDGTTVQMDDSLMEMGMVNKAAPTNATTKDLGLLLHRHDGTVAKLQFMGWDEAADKFKLMAGVTDDGDGTISGGALAPLEIGALTAAASSVSTLGTSGLATLASAIVSGEADLRGDVKLGDNASDAIIPNGSFAGDLVPNNGARKLGNPGGNKWAELHVAGEAIIDDIKLDGKSISALDAGANSDLTLAPKGTGSVAMSKVDIDGGTIDATDVTVGAGKTLDVSAGTLTLANNQISGDKVEGGTIAGITISSLVATTADINGGTIDGSIIGGTTVAAGSFAAIVGTTVSASGNVNFDGNVILGAQATDDITFNGKIQNGALVPRNDNQVDLGAAGSEFKDLYITGTGNIDSLVADTADINAGTIDGTVIGGQAQAAGDFTAIGGVARGSALFTTLGANGNVTLGDASADTISMLGSVLGNVKLAGQNAGGNLITLDIPDATDPRTIAVPDAGGVFAVSALSSTGVSLTAAGQIQMGITGAAQHSGAPENGDKLLLWDDSASAHKKVLLSQVRNYLAITYTQKAVFAASDLAAGQPLDVGGMASIDATEWHAAAEVAQEVYCNGQLLARGADAAAGMDWYKHSVSGQIKFAFDLEADDILQFVLRA